MGHHETDNHTSLAGAHASSHEMQCILTGHNNRAVLKSCRSSTLHGTQKQNSKAINPRSAWAHRALP